jgi:hypothetical protein
MRTTGLGAWLEHNGITAAEAAFVQPSYCACPPDKMLVCGTDDNTYLNECVATECARVEVAHAGECVFETDTAQQWPMAGTDGDTESEVSEPSPDDDEASACSVGGRPTLGLGWLMLVAWVGRRRPAR